MHIDDLKVRVYGNAAVVLGLEREEPIQKQGRKRTVSLYRHLVEARRSLALRGRVQHPRHAGEALGSERDELPDLPSSSVRQQSKRHRIALA